MVVISFAIGVLVGMLIALVIVRLRKPYKPARQLVAIHYPDGMEPYYASEALLSALQGESDDPGL